MREKTDFEECIENYKDDQHVEVSLWKASYNHIKVIIKGKEKTIYENGSFIFEMRTPENFPFRPPFVYCHTHIWHHNISNNIPSNRPNLFLDLINPLHVSKVGGWTPSKTLSLIVEMLKKLIHLEEPIFNIDTILNADAVRQIEERRQKFDEKAVEWTERFATDTQEVKLASVKKVNAYLNYKPFEWDLDKTVVELEAEIKKLDISNPVEIQLRSKERILPKYSTLRELGIDTNKDEILIRRTYMG